MLALPVVANLHTPATRLRVVMATDIRHRVATADHSLVRWGIRVAMAVAELLFVTRVATGQPATVQVADCSDIDFSANQRFAVISQLAIQVMQWDTPVVHPMAVAEPMAVMPSAADAVMDAPKPESSAAVIAHGIMAESLPAVCFRTVMSERRPLVAHQHQAFPHVFRVQVTRFSQNTTTQLQPY